MPGRNILGSLAEQLGSLPILALGQGNAGINRGDARCPQHLRIFRGLCLLPQPPRRLRCRQLRLCCLAQQLMRPLELASVDRGPGLRDQIARCRVIGVQRSRLLLQPFVVVGNAIKRLRETLQRHVLFANDAQQRPGRVLGDAKPFAQIDDRTRQRTRRAACRRLRQLLHLLRREPEVNVPSGRDIAGLDPRIATAAGCGCPMLRERRLARLVLAQAFFGGTAPAVRLVSVASPVSARISPSLIRPARDQVVHQHIHLA